MRKLRQKLAVYDEYCVCFGQETCSFVALVCQQQRLDGSFVFNLSCTLALRSVWHIFVKIRSFFNGNIPSPCEIACHNTEQIGRGFGDGGTALVTLGDARAPSQSCGAASFYSERRARPSTPSLCDPQFCWGRRPIFTGRDTRAERGEASGVSKVFLRIARKSILFEQRT